MPGEDTVTGGGGGGNNSEDARHCAVPYIFKYFVARSDATLRMCEDERDYENGLPNILLQFVELTGNSWIYNMQSHMIFSQLELLK